MKNGQCQVITKAVKGVAHLVIGTFILLSMYDCQGFSHDFKNALVILLQMNVVENYDLASGNVQLVSNNYSGIYQ